MWILACIRASGYFLRPYYFHASAMQAMWTCGPKKCKLVRMWTCGLVDLWTLWTCGLRGPVDSLDLWTCGLRGPVYWVDLWTCGPVDLRTLWTCGPVDSVDLWTCGPVDLWTCGPVDLWTLWTCGLCGPLYLRQRTDPRTQLLLSFLFCLVYCLLKLVL